MTDDVKERLKVLLNELVQEQASEKRERAERVAGLLAMLGIESMVIQVPVVERTTERTESGLLIREKSYDALVSMIRKLFYEVDSKENP